MDIDKAIDLRVSVREFKKKKVDFKKILKAIEAGTKAPIAGNLHAIKYILVSDKKKIEELAAAAQQSFISQVDYLVVVTTDKKFLEKYYFDRADKYSRQQAGACIENFLLKLVSFGLASCWVGAFSDETVKRVLKIPDEIEIEAILPIGYPRDPPKRIGKKEHIDSSIFFNNYKEKYMVPCPKPEAQ